MFIRFERIEKPYSYNDSPITSLSWMRHDGPSTPVTPQTHPPLATFDVPIRRASYVDLNRSPTISGPPSPVGQQPSPPSSVPTLPNSQPDAESNEDIDTSRFDFDDVPHDVSSLGQPSTFYGDNISESDVNDFKLKKLNGWLAVGNTRGVVGISFTTINSNYRFAYNHHDHHATNNTDGWASSTSRRLQYNHNLFDQAWRNGSLPSRTNYNLRGHRSEIVFVRWNEPYQKLATCDRNGVIFVWIKYEGRWSIELINDRNTRVTDFAWSHDGKMALICYMDGFVLVGSVTGQRYWSSMLNLNDCNITCGTWTPDDQQVLFGTSNGHVIVISVHGTFISQVSVQECIEICHMSWSCSKTRTKNTAQTSSNTHHSTTDNFPGDKEPSTSSTSNDPNAPQHNHGVQHNHSHLPQYNSYNQGDDHLLAIIFVDGSIYLMHSYDDVFPIVINTNLINVKLEWSGDRAMFAVGGYRMMKSSLPSVYNNGYQYINVLSFYTAMGVLKKSIVLEYNQQPLSALAWGNGDKRLFVACGQQLYVAWIFMEIPKLSLLARLKIHSCLESELQVKQLPIPESVQCIISKLFARTICCYVPNYKKIRDFVLQPPPNNIRLYCTLVRVDAGASLASTATNNSCSANPISVTVGSLTSTGHHLHHYTGTSHDQLPSSSTSSTNPNDCDATYVLYLEYMGGLIPMLKGKRCSKIKPEFIIYDPSQPETSYDKAFSLSCNGCTEEKVNVALDKDSPSSMSILMSYLTPKTRRRFLSRSPAPGNIGRDPLAQPLQRRTRPGARNISALSNSGSSPHPLHPLHAHHNHHMSPHVHHHHAHHHHHHHYHEERNEQQTQLANSLRPRLIGQPVTVFDELPERDRLMLVTSNLWGTKFKFVGFKHSMVPTCVGSVTYRTSLLHLQPRQMSMVIKEMNLENFGCANQTVASRLSSKFNRNNVQPLFNSSTDDDDDDDSEDDSFLESSLHVGGPASRTPAIVPLPPLKSTRNSMLLEQAMQQLIQQQLEPQLVQAVQIEQADVHHEPVPISPLPVIEREADSFMDRLADQLDQDQDEVITLEIQPEHKDYNNNVSAAIIDVRLQEVENRSSSNKLKQKNPVVSSLTRDPSTSDNLSQLAASSVRKSSMVCQFRNQSFQSESPKHVSYLHRHRNSGSAQSSQSNNSPNNSPSKSHNICQIILNKESPRKSSVSSCIDEFSNKKSYMDSNDTDANRTKLEQSNKMLLQSSLARQADVQVELAFIEHHVNKDDPRRYQTYNAHDDTLMSTLTVPEGGHDHLGLSHSSSHHFDSVTKDQSAECKRMAFKNSLHTKRGKSLDSSLSSSSGSHSNGSTCGTSKESSSAHRDAVSTNQTLETEDDANLLQVAQIVQSLSAKLNNHQNNTNHEQQDNHSDQKHTDSKQTSSRRGSLRKSLINLISSKPRQNSMPFLDFGQQQSSSVHGSMPSLVPSNDESSSQSEHNNRVDKTVPKSRTRSRKQDGSTILNNQIIQSIPSTTAFGSQRNKKIPTVPHTTTLNSPSVMRRMRNTFRYLDCSSDEGLLSSEDEDCNDLRHAKGMIQTHNHTLPLNNHQQDVSQPKGLSISANSTPTSIRKKMKFWNMSPLKSASFSKNSSSCTQSSTPSLLGRDNLGFLSCRPRRKVSSACRTTSGESREFRFHNKAPLWNEISQVYQLDFGGRVTQESAKNFQIEHCGRQVMQFGRIDSQAYTLDFEYPFTVAQAMAVALANVTQRLK